MMPRRFGVPLLAIVLALGMALALHAATPPVVTAPAGAYQVQVTSQPSPPKVGVNQLTITVTKSGTPVTGAGVRLHLDMAGMSMPADVKATPTKTAGQYTASANLSMAGTWKVTVAVQQMAGMKMAGDGEAHFLAQTGKGLSVEPAKK